MAGDASTLNSSAPRRFRDRNVGIAVLCWIAFWTALGWIDRPDEAQLSAVLTVASGAALTGFGAVGICRKLRCGVGMALSITLLAAFTYVPAFASLMTYVIGSRVDLSASPYRLMTEWRLVWLLGSVAAGLGTALIYWRGRRRLARLLTLLPLLLAGLYALWAERPAAPWKTLRSDPWLAAPPSQILKAGLMLRGYLTTKRLEVFHIPPGTGFLINRRRLDSPALRALLKDAEFPTRLAEQLRPRAVQFSLAEEQESWDDGWGFSLARVGEEALHRKGERLWKAGRISDGALLMGRAQVLARRARGFGFGWNGEPATDVFERYEASPARTLRLARFLQSRLGEADVTVLRSLRADLIEILRAGVLPPDDAPFEGECSRLLAHARELLAFQTFPVPFSRQVLEFFFPWERVLDDYHSYCLEAMGRKPPEPYFAAARGIPWLCESGGCTRLDRLTDWANTEAHLRLLCVGISLELKRREQPDFDPNLAPSAIGVPEFVLREPLFSHTLRFARIDGQWQPYSIGLDRRDDTGPNGRSNRYADDVTFGRLGEMSGQMRF